MTLPSAPEALIVNTETTGFQSPPKLLTLSDGRVLFVWVNDGLSDDLRTMELQGRIYNADGTPATGQPWVAACGGRV